MGRMQSVAIAFALLLAFPFSLYAQENAAENTTDFVNSVLAYPIDEVHERVLAEFDSDDRNYFDDYNRAIYELPEKVLSYKDLSPEAYDRFIAFPMVKPNKFYVFYAAYAPKQHILQDITPLGVVDSDNPALMRYAALPAQARVYDIYLWSPDSPYWFSEYTLNNTPLPFRSYFIIHLEAVDDTHTNVEVIEERPVVRIPEEPPPTKHYQIKSVAPTTRDRRFLLSCIHQFIEKNIPARNKFNCRDE